jgi:hypothetical protein
MRADKKIVVLETHIKNKACHRYFFNDLSYAKKHLIVFFDKDYSRIYVTTVGKLRSEGVFITRADKNRVDWNY